MVDAEQLNAAIVNIQASGASKINVNVSGELHSEASGASPHRLLRRSKDDRQSPVRSKQHLKEMIFL